MAYSRWYVFAGMLTLLVNAPFFSGKSTRDKYRKLKDQRANQGKEASEEHEAELRAQEELLASQMADLDT